MIAILSDFGHSEYQAIMKGVILNLSPSAHLIDLFEQVSPQNIKEAAWVLLQSYSYFPTGTIFLCVVDPGVGGKRAALAVRTKNYFFVGPDNSLMFAAASKDGIEEVVELQAEKASKTFHGRDVFAVAAAKLDKGDNFSSLGKSASFKVLYEFHLEGREGEVVRIDKFGNFITNLPHIGKDTYSVRCKGEELSLPFFDNYEKAPAKTIFLIKGSSNTLEISEKNGKAGDWLKASPGDLIEIS